MHSFMFYSSNRTADNIGYAVCLRSPKPLRASHVRQPLYPNITRQVIALTLSFIANRKKIAVKKYISPVFLTMFILVSIVLFHPNFCFAKLLLCWGTLCEIPHSHRGWNGEIALAYQSSGRFRRSHALPFVSFRASADARAFECSPCE